MGKEMKCLRCGGEMRAVRREKIQLGQTGWILGDWPNLIAGAMEVDIYACPRCGKLEFFQPQPEGDWQESGPFDVMAGYGALPQRKCPQCGRVHDFDYPKCPFCGHVY